MFLHTAGQGKKEVECMFCQGHWGSVPKPDPRADQSAMELVGYWTSRREMTDIYHSVYLLRRSPVSPPAESDREEGLFSSLTVQLQRQTLPPATEDLGPQEGEWVGLDQQGSYEVVLQAAHQRALETAKALQSNIERLTMSRGEDHKLGHAAKVGVSLECALGTGPGPTTEADIGIMLGLTVKATLMVTCGAYIPSP